MGPAGRVDLGFRQEDQDPWVLGFTYSAEPLKLCLTRVKSKKSHSKVLLLGPNEAQKNCFFVCVVTIRAHYRVQEQLQELEAVLSRKNSHLQGQTVLIGER